jgi:hypothetical protein
VKKKKKKAAVVTFEEKIEESPQEVDETEAQEVEQSSEAEGEGEYVYENEIQTLCNECPSSWAKEKQVQVIA